MSSERPDGSARRGVLDGVRIVDFTERMQGPYATQMLGDLGADIVKVERLVALAPDGSIDVRYPEGNPSLYSSMFLAANRNKRSIAVDLKSEAGKDVARRLIAAADVVYENFRPGVMDRLGFGYEDCRRLNPGIIYASASGYGPDGPYEARPGQDLLIQAIAGLGAMNVSATGRPTAVGMSISDLLGGMNGAFAVLAALLHRERTGEGQRVEVSLLDSAVAVLSEHAVHFMNSDIGEPERGTPMHAHAYIPPPYGFYATSDGYIALSSGRQIALISEVLGIPDLTKDPRFASYALRDENRAEMEEIIESRMRERTTAEWLEEMVPRDIFAAPVHTLREAFSDPQVLHNGIVRDVQGPHGPVRLVGPPYRLSASPADVRIPPPEHGAHTQEILRDLGLTDHEIAALRDQEAVA